MRKIGKLFLIMLIMMIAVTAFSFSISAAESVDQDGLEVSITTDKDEYVAGEEIRVAVTVQNCNYYSVDDLSISIAAPKGFSVKSGYLSATDIDIAAGRSRTESVYLEYTKSSNLIFLLIIPLFLLLAAIIVGVVFLVKRKKTTKVISAILCLAIVLAILPMGRVSAEDTSATISVDKTITINGKKHIITSAVKYPVSAKLEQSVDPEIAKLFGIDPNEFDSDKDGLSNYIEIYMSGTNPTLADTDEDGVSDHQEDADEDGLNNAQEVEIGTNLMLKDTDNDGLSDFKEHSEIKTDPRKYDTDNDGLSDGDEIELGLNPLQSKSDGKTLDSQRVFTQQLKNDNINGYLISEDNSAIPSLTLTTTGNINSRVSITMTDDSKFGDSRAIVGEPVDLIGDNLGTGRISFTLQDSESSYLSIESEGYYSTKLICKYSDSGQIKYLDTVFDAKTNMVSADVDGEGTYYVFDVKNLFDELGLAMPKISTAKTSAASFAVVSTHTVTNTATMKKTVSGASYNAMAQADIVFLIDTTGSMRDEINNVKNNVEHFVDALKEKGVSAGLALIDYQDIEVDGYDSTKVHKIGSSNWYYDMDAYKTAISELKLGSGGDDPECAVDALETGRLLDMRPSAGKIFILVTDATYKVANRYNILSMDAEINLLSNMGVTCAVVSPTSVKYSYQNLYEATNGVWANINGDFYTELMALADKIGSDIVGDGYWIYLDGPVPVPVRLDAEPFDGSTADTDKDGIFDVDELEGVIPTGSIDLDALINRVSKGAITDTDYGVVMMYKYQSNPAEGDSDGDGYNDIVDANPLVWDISDRDLAIATGISYTDLILGAEIDTYSTIDLGSGASVSEMKGWIIVDSLKGVGFYAAALKKDNNIVLAFRGSKGLTSYNGPIDVDWISDWVFADVINVLTGISNQVPLAEAFMMKILNKYPDYNIYICGHSLGGNLALNASTIALKFKQNVVKRVSTFNGLGMPSVSILKELYSWDFTTLACYEDRFYDYEIKGDPVSAFEIKPDHKWYDLFDVPLTIGVGHRNVLSLKVPGNEHGLENFYLQLQPLERTIK